VLLVAGCLPASLRPTSPPLPTPTPIPTAPPTPTPTPGPPTPTPAPTFRLYTVARGDTLTRIAHRFRTSQRSLAYWNRARYPSLDPETARYAPDRLQVGWVLQVIPGQEYVPPENDGETGIQVTPTPDDGDTGASASPGASPSESP
jgi:Tfp pilus assembly protein FimV